MRSNLVRLHERTFSDWVTIFTQIPIIPVSEFHPSQIIQSWLAVPVKKASWSAAVRRRSPVAGLGQVRAVCQRGGGAGEARGRCRPRPLCRWPADTAGRRLARRLPRSRAPGRGGGTGWVRWSRPPQTQAGTGLPQTHTGTGTVRTRPGHLSLQILTSLNANIFVWAFWRCKGELFWVLSCHSKHWDG